MKTTIIFIIIAIICPELLGQDTTKKKMDTLDILQKMDQKDSIASLEAERFYSKNVVTNEIKNVLFRNIYHSATGNEEDEFYQDIGRLLPFDNKIIDTIIIIQVNAFGENVYDTSARGSKIENFLSEKVHVNTKIQVIENRYMLMKEGDVFSPYQAYENARLIRTSGIFHDVRFHPVQMRRKKDRIILYVFIQDVFPYGFSLGVNGPTNVSWGIENVNLFGYNHRLATEYRINTTDIHQVFGAAIRYTIPNVIKKTFIDAYAQYRNFSLDNNIELGAFRQFSRPEFRWAGGYIISYNKKGIEDLGKNLVFFNNISNEAWLSYSFPFKSRNTTVNAIITGIGYSNKRFFDRPTISSSNNYGYWNSSFFLYSLGYSKVKFVQDRLLNGYGRTEDVPTGVSINGLYGVDFAELGTRFYYGGQVLGQYFTKGRYYINLGVKAGTYVQSTGTQRGVLDFHIQSASKAFKLGNFRLRKFLTLRTTIGINQDSTTPISLTEYNGIRGLNNTSFRGNSRFTASYQTNLFLPFSLFGFRFNVYNLLEIAKIQPNFDNFFKTPIYGGITMGLSLRNENLIFDAIQLQYGLYPSSDNPFLHGFTVSSVIPFRFQNLDISRPRVVNYE